ncbi:MAG: hypothetical protein ACRD3W_26390 [Terriglobales bacterium]
MKIATLAVAMTLMFSGLALARDHDQYKDNHDRWDKHSDRDRHHDRDHDRDRDRNRNNSNWGHDRNGDRDHDRWERDHRRNDGYYGGGQIYNRYPRGYPSGGYGYPSGRGGYGYPSGGYGYPGAGNGRGGNGGYNFGYQDGSYMARRDMSQNKPFNPNPRNEFGNRTHGYNGSFGDKNYYRSQYSSGYAAGYQSSYRGGRGWGY